MKKELKEEWVAALRSGKYKQGKGMLCSGIGKNEKFCCLGVLADICGPHLGEQFYWSFRNGWRLVTKDGDYLDDNIEGNSGKILSYSLCAKLNLLHTSEQNHLADMNDHGSSFEQIADWIEENLNEYT